jgi:hypothetical protein
MSIARKTLMDGLPVRRKEGPSPRRRAVAGCRIRSGMTEMWACGGGQEEKHGNDTGNDRHRSRHPSALILGLVPGIQLPRVGAVRDAALGYHTPKEGVSRAMDIALLDPRDKPEDEGRMMRRRRAKAAQHLSVAKCQKFQESERDWPLPPALRMAPGVRCLKRSTGSFHRQSRPQLTPASPCGRPPAFRR